MTDLLEDVLGPVALLGREDGVGLGGGDRERARDTPELILLDERGVGKEADVDTVLVVPGNVLCGYVSAPCDPGLQIAAGGSCDLPLHRCSNPDRRSFWRRTPPLAP